MSIVINDKSQGVIAKHVKKMLSYFTTHLSLNLLVTIFKIGEHLAKLQAKWLIVSCTPFALHFCPQRC